MSKRHHPKFPPVKPAKPLPPEPPDIDAVGNLSESEKAILANTLTDYGQAAGNGVSPIPAEFKATTDTEKVKAFFTSPVQTFPISSGGASGQPQNSVASFASGGVLKGPPPTKEEIRATMKEMSEVEPMKKVYVNDTNRRAFLSMDFEKLIKNIELGAPLFNGLDPFEIANVVSYTQEALIDYVLERPPQSFTLPRLNPLLLRNEEDKHNKRCLLALCHRLDISAEELTLAMLKENLEKEAWRLGESAEEIPYLEINTKNEQEWRAYKEELGLVKRKGK